MEHDVARQTSITAHLLSFHWRAIIDRDVFCTNQLPPIFICATYFKNMRAAAFFGLFRLSLRGGPCSLRFASPARRCFFPRPQSNSSHRSYGWRKASAGKVPATGRVLLAALSPGAFLQLAEEGDDGEQTAEWKMLEVSRKEMQETVPKDARGLARIGQAIYIFFCSYIYEPMATGIRFFHLVFIFLPVMVAVPAMWFGRRVQGRNGERSGTLWWFDFLVCSMERAGPTFIKVRNGHSRFFFFSFLFSIRLTGIAI